MSPVTSEDVELIAKTSGEVVAALAEQSGALGPVKRLADYVTQRIGLYLAPKLAERATAAADKIRASGLSRRAYGELDNPMLIAILEGMAQEDDSDLQRTWENLLANAATEGSAEVRRAFPRILQDLDPKDARLLDEFSRRTSDATFMVTQFGDIPGERDGVALDNLTRLEVLRPVRSYPTTVGAISDGEATITGYVFTELGWAFVKACQPPQAAD
jgi:hypothetical protein